jgi:hypothetical protein
VPIDKPEATAATNTRRKFLARAAMGGALAAVSAPLLSTLSATAQDAPTSSGDAGSTPSLPDGPYLILATQLEQAAVVVYQAALQDTTRLQGDARTAAQAFQGHHATVAERLIGLMDAPTAKVALTPDAGVIEIAGSLANADAATTLTTLGTLEADLAATHLWALGGIEDGITAQNAAQILAVENQHVLVLGRLGDAALSSLVPPSTTTDGAFSDRVTGVQTQISDSTSTTAAGATTTTAAATTTTAAGTTTTQETGN